MNISEQIHHLFGTLFENDLINEICKVAKTISLEKGQLIIDRNEQIKSIPLVLKGSLKILREDNQGHELFLYYIETGNTCAATLNCCINNQKSNIIAIAEEDCAFLAIPVEKMDEWMSTYKTWRTFILKNYAKRHEELLEVVDLLAFKKMDDRILNYIQEKADVHKSNTLTLSHQDIAYDLNTSREVVSRLVKQMERKGILALSRGKIELLK